MQNSEGKKTQGLVEQAYDYKVQPKDRLTINIISLDENINKYINRNSSLTKPDDLSTGYIVNDSGFINLPVIGNFNVKEKTITCIKDSLESQFNKFFKETVVQVGISNYKITVLGEVKSPGVFNLPADRINIFQLLAQAGELTEIANRKTIKLVRQTNNGTNIYDIDLTQQAIIESPYYYLTNNDIIYVEPLRQKSVFVNISKLTPFLSVFTILLTSFYYINIINKK